MQAAFRNILFAHPSHIAAALNILICCSESMGWIHRLRLAQSRPLICDAFDIKAAKKDQTFSFFFCEYISE